MSGRGHQGLLLGSDAGDPYWANVVSLLSCGGSLTDAKGKVWTAAGTAGAAAIVTDANTPLGYSCYLNGGWLTTPSSTDFDFGNGDFTIEMFLRHVSHDAFGEFFIRRASTSLVAPFALLFSNTANTVTAALSTDGTNWKATPASTNTMGSTRVHIALVRHGAAITVYVGGTSWATDASSLGTSALMASTQPLSIGANGDGTQKINGYVDQFRVTKGVARYISNFSPPVVPFPNHA